MKIGIDARLYGLKHAGIGRYVKNVVDQLIDGQTEHQYVLFVSDLTDFERAQDKAKLIVMNVPHYSLREQLLTASVFEKENLDVLHVPHFNAPLLYRGKMVVTIHDLIKHDSKGPETTTHSKAIYWFKFYGYKILAWLVARKANKIIVPSIFVKEDVVKKLNVDGGKIEVVYEAVEKEFLNMKSDERHAYKLMNKFSLVKPFMVYTGSVYPHKNLDIVLEAIKVRNIDRTLDFMLAVVCARSVFYERLLKKIEDMGLTGVVKLMGFLNDQELVDLYSEAFCLVQPSKMEGFGLTGLEAMSRGLPVIAANASCLPEIYGEAALYFSVDSPQDFLYRLDELVTNKNLYDQLQINGKKRVKQYSWKKNAISTLKIYEAALRS